jgi:hypothetical protein
MASLILSGLLTLLSLYFTLRFDASNSGFVARTWCAKDSAKAWERSLAVPQGQGLTVLFDAGFPQEGLASICGFLLGYP